MLLCYFEGRNSLSCIIVILLYITSRIQLFECESDINIIAIIVRIIKISEICVVVDVNRISTSIVRWQLEVSVIFSRNV